MLRLRISPLRREMCWVDISLWLASSSRKQIRVLRLQCLPQATYLRIESPCPCDATSAHSEGAFLLLGLRDPLWRRYPSHTS